MERTQIYLTKEEREALERIAKHKGESQSAVIRRAVDRYIERYQSQGRNTLFRQAKGLWRDRTDIPNVRELRKEWDREVLETTDDHD